ncbi:MAG TPA: FkbM family methyltransferase [Candidatus Kapabacteria bacterium]|jgi:FkbM family methyltransferase
MNLLKRLFYLVLPASLTDRFKIWRSYAIFDRFEARDFPEWPAIARFITKGDRVVDVGANIGLVAKLFAQHVGSSGRVLSFEPVPYTFRILTRNITHAGLSQVELFDCAISDVDGTAMIEVPTYAESPNDQKDNSGAFGQVRNYYAAHIARESSDAHESSGRSNLRTSVTVRSLDSLFAADPSPISFLKCDAEGHEFECMRGAAAILERDRPPLFIELCSDPDEEGSGVSQMTAYLSRFGYQPYLYREGKWMERPAGTFVHDLFYLIPEQLARWNAG